MVSIWRQILYRLGVAAQLVRHHDPRLTELRDQLGEKAPGSLGVTVCLNQYIKNIAVGVDCPPEPELLPSDHDDGLIDMPLVVWLRSVPANTVGKMMTKAIDPKTYRFSADDNTALCQKIFNIGRAQGKSVIGSIRVGYNFTWKTKPLQAGKAAWHFHYISIRKTLTLNNLAIPTK